MTEQKHTEPRATAPRQAETPPPEPPPEKLAEEIEHLSSEGRPAHPETPPRHLGILLVAIFLVIIAVALVVGFVVAPRFGVLVALLGGALFIVGPPTWATLNRAEDRRVARERVEKRDARRGGEGPAAGGERRAS